MKHNSSIYILCLHPVFNKELVPRFESLDKEYSSYLYESLLLNHKELTDKLSESSNIIFCFDKNDSEHLTEIFSQIENKDFIDPDQGNVLKSLSEKYFIRFNNNIVMFFNSIGITPDDLKNALNLMSIEDEAIVLGRSINESLSFFGFNSFNKEIFEETDLLDLNYDSFLNRAAKYEHFIHVLDNFMLIKNIEDFKELYYRLSKKESFAYCSQEIHERFTNLFIEYKDLLK
ncbi:MAG: hypothetical protein WCE54_18625 [Ignavibacteriaceae bacterium]